MEPLSKYFLLPFPKIVIFVFVGIILLSGGSVALMMQMEIGPFANEEKKATVDSTPKDEKPEKNEGSYESKKVEGEIVFKEVSFS